MIVVYTLACSSLPSNSEYSEFVSERVNAFKSYVTELSTEKISRDLPFLPVDNTERVCPDGREWVPELFTLIVERCSASGIYPFVQALAAEVGAASSEDRNRSSTGGQDNTKAEPRRINLDDEQQERVKKGMRRSVFVGAVIGAVAAMLVIPAAPVIGVPALLLGGATGAALGFWRWISKK